MFGLKLIRKLDLVVLASTLVLLAIGLTVLYSSGLKAAQVTSQLDTSRQFLYGIVGIGVMLFFARLDYRVLRNYSMVLYIVMVASLLAVDAFGASRLGATRWISIGFFQFQPSEFAKPMLAIVLAQHFSRHYDHINELKYWLGSLLYLVLPLGLVLAQPDLGTGMVLMAIWFAMAIAARVRWQYLAGLVASAWRYRIAQLRRVQLAQQIFARRLIESQETERKRIAAELHDSLGQNLLVIKNRAMINALTLQDERAKTQFDEFSAAVSHSLEEVRTISHDLRPPHLDQLGLRTALVAMIEKVAASSTIQFTHTIAEVDGLLPPGDEIMLYRIVQESLNNILKHSGATQATVKITVRAEVFTLTIQDNGRGFTPNGAEGTLPPKVGLGLQSIAERVRILGGTHTIQSVPSQGTTTTVRIELADEQT